MVLREMARDFLTDCGYRVLEAGSGREALQIWWRHRAEIDLLLTDMKMPEGISGMDLAEKMLAEQPALRVILTSGYSDDIVSPEILAAQQRPVSAQALFLRRSHPDRARIARPKKRRGGGLGMLAIRRRTLDENRRRAYKKEKMNWAYKI